MEYRKCVEYKCIFVHTWQVCSRCAVPRPLLVNFDMRKEKQKLYMDQQLLKLLLLPVFKIKFLHAAIPTEDFWLTTITPIWCFNLILCFRNNKKQTVCSQMKNDILNVYSVGMAFFFPKKGMR